MAALHFHFDIDGEDFSSAGEASVEMKKKLRQLGFPGLLSAGEMAEADAQTDRETNEI